MSLFRERVIVQQEELIIMPYNIEKKYVLQLGGQATAATSPNALQNGEIMELFSCFSSFSPSLAHRQSYCLSL